MKVIVNNRRVTECPLCKSKKIFQKWVINYQLPILFSDRKIDLKLKPQLWLCSSCLSTFIQNTINEIDAIDLYSNNIENRWVKNKFADNKTEQLVNIIKSCINNGNKVLDIGTNTGEFLDFCLENKCKTFGVEYSKIGREQSRVKGHKIFESIDKIPKELKFDVITAFDVSEHIYDLDLFIRKCKTKLLSGGVLILLTGNPNCFSARLAGEKWWYYSYPEHIVFPSERYFKNITNLQFISYTPVFNDNGFRGMNIFTIDISTIRRIFDMLVLMIIKREYNGLPSFDKDHAIIVLKNK